MNENKNAHKDIATTPRPQMAASGRLDFISFRIAQKIIEKKCKHILCPPK